MGSGGKGRRASRCPGVYSGFGLKQMGLPEFSALWKRLNPKARMYMRDMAGYSPPSVVISCIVLTSPRRCAIRGNEAFIQRLEDGKYIKASVPGSGSNKKWPGSTQWMVLCKKGKLTDLPECRDITRESVVDITLERRLYWQMELGGAENPTGETCMFVWGSSEVDFGLGDFCDVMCKGQAVWATGKATKGRLSAVTALSYDYKTMGFVTTEVK